RNPACGSGVLHGCLQHRVAIISKTCRVVRDEGIIDFSVFDKYSRDGVVEEYIGTGNNLKVEICQGCTLCPSGIHYDNANARIVLLVLFNSPEKNRVAPCRICTGDKKTIGK